MSTGVVVVVRGATLPAAALKILRDATAVYAATDLDASVFGVPAVTEAPSLKDVVLLAGSRDEPAASLLIATGAEVIETPAPPLVEAAEVMDRLRSPGGCPWDAAQTHDSLRQYLVEETYELLDAIESGDREALREELGDVLLQVLFHARVAAEDAADPFGIDEVAADLVAKLVGRHPHVFAGADSVHTVEHQNVKWEELKQQEKQRKSIVDGVALGQPAVALAGKLGQRSGRAGIPLDLFPAGTAAAAQLFRIAATARRAGVDPEGELRAMAKQFANDVRAAEQAARDVGLEPTTLEADGWRKFWPPRPV
ncbi:Nucleoside triphosphate pyrophosphohydrolase MazG (EC [Amycolatopsis camponoti]|uniref:Nucleoside triphosphate pyrophosphohydrolase MazG (EC) n=1 Tax=Amycolatopsis camponoti TaxID=2606593 RepID=A0A6I8LEF7_9PSEU|nr:MazG family protein [Amycolatopsis camponoti]VVJ15421.1 Nucleoside triphosphate pyrophosphohydrolase MazG (EC [Amycolatopsis camponoti]